MAPRVQAAREFQHALSHGWLQKGEADDIGVMHKLMLNPLTEKSIANYRARRAAAAKKK